MSPWTVRHGDALTILPTLPAASVDLVLTNPEGNEFCVLRSNAERAG